MKRLLFTATVLLFTAKCDVDVAKITDTLMASSRSDQETTTGNSDFSEKQVWWKREKRKNGGQAASTDEPRFYPESRLFARSLESSSLLAAIRHLGATERQSEQDDWRNRATREYLRYRNANPIAIDQSHFRLCDSRNKCTNRRQAWQMQKPFYVEEPSWIDIDEESAENEPIYRLKSADPFVISRGKRIRGVGRSKERSKYQNVDVFVKNRFADENDRFFDSRLKLKNDQTYDDNEYFSGLQRTSGQNYFRSSDKMDDRRSDDGNLFEGAKSKRFESDLNSNTDLDSNPSIGRLTAKEISERLMENLECDSRRYTDHFGRASKRMRLGDGRGMLEELLTKSDPFYVARGKRAPLIFNFPSETNDLTSRESTISPF